MEITIKHFGGQYPSFNVALHTHANQDAFLEIKGCRLVNGSNGEFVSWPSRKQDNGKYWNHVYGSEAFNAAVLKKVHASAPAPAPRQDPPRSSGFDDLDNDLPF